jgi:hypothetical protein
MTARMKTIAMSVTLILTSRILIAADDAQHPCAHLRNDTERLACYDQAFGKPAAAAAATAAAPQEQFGFTEKELARNTGQSAVSAAAESVTAAITSLVRRHDGKFVVTLDNAQVWAQSEFNSQADVEIGDSVTVRRGALGSYLLVTKAKIGTRVKRVK